MSEPVSHHEEEVLGKAYDSRLMRRLLAYVRPYGDMALGALGLILLSSLLQLLAPLATAVALDLFIRPPVSASQLAAPSAALRALLLARGIDPADVAVSGLTVVAIAYFAILALTFCALYAQGYVLQLMGQYIIKDIRGQIFGHLQRLPLAFYDRNPIGRLVTRVTTDVDALNEMFTAGFVSIFGDIFVLAGIVGMLFWMNWRMALVLFSIIPLIVLVSAWFRRGARITYRATRARIAAINAFLQEHLSGMATVQLFNREADEAEKFEGLNARHRDANLQSVFYYSIFYPVVELIETIGLALIVWYGGGQVLRGMLSIGTLIAFFQYAQRFYEPISDLPEKYNILQAARGARERIFKAVDPPPRILDEGTLEIDHFESIEFRDVCFAYHEKAGMRDEGRGKGDM